MKEFFSDIKSIGNLIRAFLYLPLIIFPYLFIEGFTQSLSLILSILFFILIGIKIAFVDVIRYKSKGNENREDEEMSKHPILITLQFFVFVFSILSLIILVLFFYKTENVIALIFILITLAGLSYFITGMVLVFDRIWKNTQKFISNLKMQKAFKWELIK